MSGFKLLAIRPLKGCDPKFLKNLKEGLVYSFYQGYKYYVKDSNSKEFEILPSNYDSLKHLKISRVAPPNEKMDLYSYGDLKIDISAVVGKNGSGKSSITELFFKYLFELSVKKILKRDPSKHSEYCIDLNKEILTLSQEQQNFNSSKILSDNKYTIEEFEDEIDRIGKYNEFDTEIKKIHSIEKDLLKNSILNHFEVYYEIDGVPNWFSSSNKFPFYSIVINHSSYSLNSDVIGQWIEKLFHKNDGYETPIVLNPMRTNGNIDTNNEAHLNKTRLLLNLQVSKLIEKDIQNIQFLRKIPNQTRGKSFNTIFQILTDENYFSLEGNVFKAIKVKNNELSGKILTVENSSIEKWTIAFSKKINENFPNISIIEFPKKIDFNNEIDKKWFLKLMLFRYLQFKLIKYAKFKREGSRTTIDYQIKDFSFLLKQLKQDSSHQTFKLFQILHLLHDDNFYNFYSSLELAKISKTKIELEISEKSFINYQSKFKFLEGLPSNIDIFKVPAAFFSVNFQFQNESKFEQLSSGEIQFLNSINQVTYHLRNIDSLNYSFDMVNIIFDEVELYFHVEYQRLFISKFLDAIKSLKLNRINKINIQFLTHSPFILSDIPSTNILRLKDGEPQLYNPSVKTFGANIHDLLANDFFLKNGFMGEFAKEKINNIISYLTYHINKKEIDELEFKNNIEILDFQRKKFDALISQNKYIIDVLKIETSENPDLIKSIIETIGEAVIKFKLNEMHDLAFNFESNAKS